MGKKSSIYKQNLELFMERFPQLGLLSCEWTFAPVEEEGISLSLEKEEILYFYGLGIGSAYFQAKEWLSKNSEHILIFLEEEPGRIASFLQRKEAFEVLSNRQVHLAWLPRGRAVNRELDALADRFPCKRVEVASLPSLQGRKFRNLRLKILRKTALSYALHQDRLHGYQPFHNFVQNVRRIPESFYANALKGAFQDVPAIVCGAGPSLQQSMETLRRLENKALILAGGSTIAALSSQGLLPHFGMAIDPNLEEYRRLKNSFAFEGPLLYSTRVFPAIFQTCNGPFGYMRSGIGGVPELWIEEELGLLDPLLGEFLSPESISVTTICLAWAQFLGCNPIFLNGVDLAYTGNKRYALGVGEEEEVRFSAIDQEKSAADRILERKDRKGKSIYTAVRWVMESASISHFAKKHPEVRFLNTTEGGIGFRNIDFLPLLEAEAKYLQREWDLRGLVHQKIAAASMPSSTHQIIKEQLQAMEESLERIIGHLQVLTGEKKGAKALAEMEIVEEMAYPYLFYDIHRVLEVILEKAALIGEERQREKWKRFLKLSQQYKEFLIKS